MPVALHGASSSTASTGAAGDQSSRSAVTTSAFSLVRARLSRSRARRLSDDVDRGDVPSRARQLHRLAARARRRDRARCRHPARAAGPGARPRYPVPTSFPPRSRAVREQAPRRQPNMPGELRDAAERLGHRAGRAGIGKRQVERRRRGNRGRRAAHHLLAPGALPAIARHRPAVRRISGKRRVRPHQRAEHAVDELARAAIDERQCRRDRGMRRRAERECLDKRDAQRESRLGVIGQRPLA